MNSVQISTLHKVTDKFSAGLDVGSTVRKSQMTCQRSEREKVKKKNKWILTDDTMPNRK
jgi:hypothetical protein